MLPQLAVFGWDELIIKKILKISTQD